jgi:hypothetical protein
MQKKDLFTITISILAILLLLTTPLSQKVKDIGNKITGYQVAKTAKTSPAVSVTDSSGSPSEKTPPSETPVTEETQPVSKSPQEEPPKEQEVSRALKSPDPLVILSTLKFSKPEKIIVKELAREYLQETAFKTQYSKPKKEKKLPKEVRLSIPQQDTDLIIGVKENIYPYINLNIKA